MTIDEKIRTLCGQLLRAENPVVDTVAAELHHAIEDYVRSAKRYSGPDIIPESLPYSSF